MSVDSDREYLNKELSHIRDLSREMMRSLSRLSLAVNGGFVITVLAYIEAFKRFDNYMLVGALLCVVGLLATIFVTVCYAKEVFILNEELPDLANKCLSGAIGVMEVYKQLEDRGPKWQRVIGWFYFDFGCFSLALFVVVLKFLIQAIC